MTKAAHDSPEKRQLLKEAIRDELAKESPEDGLTRLSPSDRQAFCDNKSLGRFLRARRGDVDHAKKLLVNTLEWRGKMKLHSSNPFSIADFSSEIELGKMYVAGNDSEGRSVMITRKKTDGYDGHYDQYLRHLCFVLETACRSMKQGQESWFWIMDMRGYSRANAPPISISLSTLRILADSYPERLHRVIIVDAPSIFSIVWSAVSLVLDPVTTRKVVFLSSAEWKKKVEASRKAREAGAAPDPLAYEEYFEFYEKDYDKDSYLKLLKSAGWMD